MLSLRKPTEVDKIFRQLHREMAIDDITKPGLIISKEQVKNGNPCARLLLLAYDVQQKSNEDPIITFIEEVSNMNVAIYDDNHYVIESRDGRSLGIKEVLPELPMFRDD